MAEQHALIDWPLTPHTGWGNYGIQLAQALLENFRQEEELRREAERLAEAHMPAGQAVDRHKVVQMITQRLAEERSFVL